MSEIHREITLPVITSLIVCISGLTLTGCDLESEQRQLYFQNTSNTHQIWQERHYESLRYRACGTGYHPCNVVTVIDKEKEK